MGKNLGSEGIVFYVTQTYFAYILHVIVLLNERIRVSVTVVRILFFCHLVCLFVCERIATNIKHFNQFEFIETILILGRTPAYNRTECFYSTKLVMSHIQCSHGPSMHYSLSFFLSPSPSSSVYPHT